MTQTPFVYSWQTTATEMKWFAVFFLSVCGQASSGQSVLIKSHDAKEFHRTRPLSPQISRWGSGDSQVASFTLRAWKQAPSWNVTVKHQLNTIYWWERHDKSLVVFINSHDNVSRFTVQTRGGLFTILRDYNVKCEASYSQMCIKTFRNVCNLY